MRATIGKLGIAMAITALIAACGDGGTPKLMHMRAAGQGPDEFGILPTKPLQMPQNLAELPAPTPGGANLSDPTPVADAVAALGGRPAGLSGNGAPAVDGALVARATRYGTDATIRTELAADDLQYRRDHSPRLLERLFSINSYFKAYQPMALNQQDELERWRAAGAITPGAPPAGVVKKAQ
ncbi:MAG TPA: DUF3035 domain-containing protein [Paenirhodobacter sp.]